jgi:MFS family permease
VGLIVGSQLVNKAAKDRPTPNVILFGLFALGAGAALLGGFRNIVAAAVSTFTIGLAVAFVYVPGQTLSQKETPPAMVGRVSSTFMALFSFSQVLGLLLSGILAERLGIRPLFLTAAAALAVLSSIAWIWLRPRPQADPA